MKKTFLRTGTKAVNTLASSTFGIGSDAQEWLDKQYPTLESKAGVEILEVKREGAVLIGSLSLQGFSNLKELYINKNPNEDAKC